MSFNGSFGEAEFANEENPNDISLGQEDIKTNLTKGGNIQKNSDTKCFINNEISIPTNSNNNIFCSVPMELEEESNNGNININITNNDYYLDLLSKELLKYNLGNMFNILNNKKIIIQSNIFYFLKNIYKNKMNKIIKAQVLYLKISSNLNLISKIFRSHRINVLFQAFQKIKRKYLFLEGMKENKNNNFRAKFELNYKKEKNNIINKSTENLNSLKKEIQIMKKNINQLTLKESKLKQELNDCLRVEKQLNEKIKILESLNFTVKKSIQTNNSSSNRSISKNDNEMVSLENAIEVNKLVKKEKQEIINAFMKKVNNLLSEYQTYIDNLKTLEFSGTNTNTNNNMNMEITPRSNLQSIKQKDTSENSLFTSKFSVKNQSNEI